MYVVLLLDLTRLFWIEYAAVDSYTKNNVDVYYIAGKKYLYMQLCWFPHGGKNKTCKFVHGIKIGVCKLFLFMEIIIGLFSIGGVRALVGFV